MIIHDENTPTGLIYLHIPKVAGTSIERAFGLQDSVTLNYHYFTGWDPNYRIWLQHATLLQIKQWWGDKLNNYFIFTFVRNPWDRAVSDWLWFKHNVSGSRMDFSESTLRDYLLCTNKFAGLKDFNNRERETYRSDHAFGQHHFMMKEDGSMFDVDYIGKFENLQQDWNDLMSVLSDKYKRKIDLVLPHNNMSKSTDKKHYTHYYDDETIQLVRDRYANDIELFDYEYGQ